MSNEIPEEVELNQEDDAAARGVVTLPCAPQPYATSALSILLIGLGIILFGLYATSQQGFPELVEAANGIGLALMCFGFSVLLDSRPPSTLEFDPIRHRMIIQESFFVRAMPSLAVPYSAIERIEPGEPGFRHRVPVRIILENGGSMTFRIAGGERTIDESFIGRLGLDDAEGATGSGADIDKVLPFAPAGESDATAGLLREFEGDEETSMVWKPRAFGRAVRFRLLSVLSLVLVAWALTGQVPAPIPGVILSIVVVSTLWMLYRLSLTQRREYVAWIDRYSLSMKSRAAGYDITVPREEIERCGAFLDPDDPIRYLDIHGPEPGNYPSVRPALDPDGKRTGIRVPVGRLTYGEAIGLAGRIELALHGTGSSRDEESPDAPPGGAPLTRNYEDDE